MRTIMDSVGAEYRRYKALAEGAISQLTDEQLNARILDSGNSVATICAHVVGNLKSRFTDFLTSDGEKPWRDREAEFDPGPYPRADVLRTWADGWGVLLSALEGLTDADCAKTVTIRTQPLTVLEALHRSLSHCAYHVGQIVDHAHTLKGAGWKYLSIPPGGTAAYNANPGSEKAAAHAAHIAKTTQA